jgi:acetyltransferase
VQLNLTDADAVRAAYAGIRTAVTERRGAEHFEGVTVQPMIDWSGYELILGSSIDAQFGPVLLFGLGGQLVEVFKDRALGLPPLTTTLARRMMEQTRIHTALKGVRGREAVDLEALEQLLVRFSQLVAEQRWVAEIDINPLLASAERLIALDARVVLHDAATPVSALPRLAIRAYPRRYEGEWTSADGTTLRIRPIRPEDEPLVEAEVREVAAVDGLRRERAVEVHDERTAHERLIRICFVDYDRELALVAEHDGADGRPEIVAIGRLSKVHGTANGEFAILVTDSWQGRGIGTELLRRVVAVARNEGLACVNAQIAADNTDMREVAERVGFTIEPVSDTLVRAVMRLDDGVA